MPATIAAAFMMLYCHACVAIDAILMLPATPLILRRCCLFFHAFTPRYADDDADDFACRRYFDALPLMPRRFRFRRCLCHFVATFMQCFRQRLRLLIMLLMPPRQLDVALYFDAAEMMLIIFTPPLFCRHAARLIAADAADAVCCCHCCRCCRRYRHADMLPRFDAILSTLDTPAATRFTLLMPCLPPLLSPCYATLYAMLSPLCLHCRFLRASI